MLQLANPALRGLSTSFVSLHRSGRTAPATARRNPAAVPFISRATSSSICGPQLQLFEGRLGLGLAASGHFQLGQFRSGVARTGRTQQSCRQPRVDHPPGDQRQEAELKAEHPHDRRGLPGGGGCGAAAGADGRPERRYGSRPSARGGGRHGSAKLRYVVFEFRGPKSGRRDKKSARSPHPLAAGSPVHWNIPRSPRHGSMT